MKSFQEIAARIERMGGLERLGELALAGSKHPTAKSDGIGDCERCSNARWVVTPGGAKRCRCLVRHANRRALAAIPRAHFGRPKLSRLRELPGLHPKQPAVVRLVRANPEASYLLAGDNGVGKTHLGWALYRAALCRKRRAVGDTLQRFLDEFRVWELLSPDEQRSALRGERKGRPRVLPEDLRAGRWTLLFDEFDKARVSEFTSRQLFELINAARDFGHQVIVTTNKPWDDLRATWCAIDEVYGDSIMTRLRMCRYVALFKGDRQ